MFGNNVMMTRYHHEYLSLDEVWFHKIFSATTKHSDGRGTERSKFDA
jgi:hypothetical protein